MKVSKLAAAIILATAANAASAQVYGELGYNFVNLDFDSFADASVGMLGITIGNELHENLAVEAAASFGVTDDSIDDIDVKVEYSYGFFLKPKLNATDSLELFAKFGWFESKLKGRFEDQRESDRDSDFAYGLGAQYDFNEAIYIIGSWVNFYDKNDVEAESWNLGVGYRFF
jgi:hypothetical protein